MLPRRGTWSSCEVGSILKSNIGVKTGTAVKVSESLDGSSEGGGVGMNWEPWLRCIPPSASKSRYLLLGLFRRCPNIDIRVATQFELLTLEWHKVVDLAAHPSTTCG